MTCIAYSYLMNVTHFEWLTLRRQISRHARIVRIQTRASRSNTNARTPTLKHQRSNTNARTIKLEHRYPALRNGKIVSMPRDVRLQVFPSITIGHIRPSTRDLWRQHRKIVVAKGLTTNILDEEIQFYGMMILYCTKQNSMITVPPSFVWKSESCPHVSSAYFVSTFV